MTSTLLSKPFPLNFFFFSHLLCNKHSFCLLYQQTHSHHLSAFNIFINIFLNIYYILVTDQGTRDAINQTTQKVLAYILVGRHNKSNIGLIYSLRCQRRHRENESVNYNEDHQAAVEWLQSLLSQ